MVSIPHRKSIWVFHLNSGACNACDIEIIDAITPYHDVERLGVKLVGSPRHADAILLTGPITIEALPKVVRAILAVPEPKIVIAIGSCACGGGIWRDSYAVLGGVDRLYTYLREHGIEPPITIYIPGCPPKPEAIVYALAMVRGLVEQKQKKIEYIEKPSIEVVEYIEKLSKEAKKDLEKFFKGIEVR